jgi:hypothetical protein
MKPFKTFRVRFCESQMLAINLSARSADDAIALARQIREDIGHEPFEEIDGASDSFEAEEISGADLPPQRQRKSVKTMAGAS